MARKTVKFSETGARRLPNDKPVIYRIQTESGKTNYVGVAKRGRVPDRIREHLAAGEIPGAKVQVEQVSSIQEAEKKEQNVISRTRPKYNEQR